MSKELEALDNIKSLLKDDWVDSIWKPYYDTIKQALIKSQEQENENKELKEKVKRWHDLLLKSDIDSKGIVVDEIENYWDIKAGV